MYRLNFMGINHISGLAEVTVIKFHHIADKLSLKGAWSGSRDPF